ncbi:MAG: hypothetical protein HQ553_12535 [Chloroflexi bacterium]|nr:hypothetical protein [Chloroflexota bacterium]
MSITSYEKETIINFNAEEDIAYIYTHDTGWQKHLETKLGLAPIETNAQNGKTYTIDKKRIPKPRAPKKYSEETLAKMRARISNLRSSNEVTTVFQGARKDGVVQ